MTSIGIGNWLWNVFVPDVFFRILVKNSQTFRLCVRDVIKKCAQKCHRAWYPFLTSSITREFFFFSVHLFLRRKLTYVLRTCFTVRWFRLTARASYEKDGSIEWKLVGSYRKNTVSEPSHCQFYCQADVSLKISLIGIPLTVKSRMMSGRCV